jgi:hypothetical protein
VSFVFGSHLQPAGLPRQSFRAFVLIRRLAQSPLQLKTQMSIVPKFLAEHSGRIEDHAQMKGRMKAHSGNFIAAFVSAAFLWALALSVAPQLHERVHPDANRAEHTCAVTFIASGSYDHSTHAPLMTAPVPPVQFSKIPALSLQWVQSPFLGASIFEHAPPPNS